MWKILVRMEVPHHLVFFNASDKHNSAVVLIDKYMKIQKSIRQSCILSPILFKMYGEHITRKIFREQDLLVALKSTMYDM